MQTSFKRLTVATIWLRRVRHISRRSLAKRLGCSTYRLTQIEKGKHSDVWSLTQAFPHLGPFSIKEQNMILKSWLCDIYTMFGVNLDKSILP